MRSVRGLVQRAKLQLRLRLWLFGVRRQAAATGSTVELVVDPEARVSRRVRVQFARGTQNRISIGARTHVRDGVLIQLRGGTIEIGPDCDVREDCRFNIAGRLVVEGTNILSWGCTFHVTEEVRVREMAICSEYVTIVDSRHFHSGDGRWVYSNSESSPVEIGRNAWIAAKATVIMGAQIGDHALVAANSVVGGVVDPATVVAGIPARVIRSSLR